MKELLPFLQKYEVWVYVFLGAIAFVYFQKLILAWKQWQGTVFGLERDIAQRRFSTALTIIVLLLVFVLMEFVIVSFVAPTYPQMVSLPTATLDLLATPTATLPVAGDAATAQAGSGAGVSGGGETSSPDNGSAAAGGNGASAGNGASGTNSASGAEASATGTLTTTATLPAQEGCIPGQIEWTFPKSGGEISATVELKGTVNVPNLGFYKYEYAEPGKDVWNTIAAGNQAKIDGQIGFCNTSQLTPGDYQLRLVVADNQNKMFPACVIPVRVVGEAQP